MFARKPELDSIGTSALESNLSSFGASCVDDAVDAAAAAAGAEGGGRVADDDATPAAPPRFLSMTVLEIGIGGGGRAAGSNGSKLATGC